MSSATASSKTPAQPEVEEVEENVEEVYEETAPQDPMLRLAELRHLIAQPEPIVAKAEAAAAMEEALAIVRKNNLSSHYELLVPEPAQRDAALVAEMAAANAAEAAALDAKEAEAVATAGDVEVLAAQLEKAALLARSAPKAAAMAAYEACLAKAVGGAARIDTLMSMLRLSIAEGGDIDETTALLRRAEALVEKEGDWERRNRLGVYRAAHAVWARDTALASKLLMASIPTFTCTELMSFEAAAFLTVMTSLLHAGRGDLKAKVIDSPDVLQAAADIPHALAPLAALHECRYKDYFRALIAVAPFAQRDRFLSRHREHVLKEARLVAYAQFLRSYQSVTLEAMGALFGVSAAFLDEELARFVAAGRLPCKIDAVSGVVEMAHPDTKTAQFQELLKNGDAVLSRIQRISQKLKSA